MSHMQTHTHARMHAHMHAHTHTHMHTHTHTHANMHIHTYKEQGFEGGTFEHPIIWIVHVIAFTTIMLSCLILTAELQYIALILYYYLVRY